MGQVGKGDAQGCTHVLGKEILTYKQIKGREILRSRLTGVSVPKARGDAREWIGIRREDARESFYRC